MRDGTRAVELVTKANQLTGGKDASVLNTPAAARAEVGDFEKTVECQKKALGDPAFEAGSGTPARERLTLCEQKKSSRE